MGKVKRRNLDNFDTEVFVTSTIYFPKDELEKFISAFTSIEIIDEKLETYVNILKEILKEKGFDNLPANPEQRKNKIVNMITKKIDLIPSAIHKEKVETWFKKAVATDQDLDLYDESLQRYCWYEFLDRAERENLSSTPFRDKLNIKPFCPDIGDEEIKPVGEVEEEKEEFQEVFPTGVRMLDSIVKMRRTNFVVVAARTGIGKSLFMINQAIYNAKKGTRVLYVSLEESDAEIKRRVNAHIASATSEERKKVNENFFVYSAKISSPDSIFNQVDKVIDDKDIRAVFFDYLQLMKYPSMHDFDSLRTLTRELKLYATSRNVLVVTASQLRREAELMGSGIAQLFGSSTIEADANAIILMEPVNAQAQKIENRCPIIIDVAKNRSGESKKIESIMVDYSCGHIGVSS